MTGLRLRPFRIEVPQDAIDDLRRRLADTRWPAPLPSAAWERGVPVRYLQELARYWGEQFDWRAQEDLLNSYPQYLTEIDGQTVHYLMSAPQSPARYRCYLLHGWPGSVVEFLDLIELLTNPQSDGAGVHACIRSRHTVADRVRVLDSVVVD